MTAATSPTWRSRPAAGAATGQGTGGGSLLRNGIGEYHLKVQHRRDPDQIVDERTLVALLNPIHGLAVETGQLGNLLLGQALAPAGVAEVVTEFPAASENPVGRGGRHSHHAGLIKNGCLYRRPYI